MELNSPMRRRSNLVALGAAVVFAVTILALVSGWLDQRGSLILFDCVAVVALAVATWALWKVARAVGPSGAATMAWRLVSVGVGIYALAQAILTAYRLAGPEAPPFPSSADIFFVTGQVLIAVGLVLHIIAYARTGLPLGSAVSYVIMYVIAGAVSIYLIRTLDVPMWADASRPMGEKVLNTLYHILDLLTLFAAMGVFRIAVVLRGGSLATGWAAIAVGFAFVMVGTCSSRWRSRRSSR